MMTVLFLAFIFLIIVAVTLPAMRSFYKMVKGLLWSQPKVTKEKE